MPHPTDRDIKIVRNYVQSAHKLLGGQFLAAYWLGSRQRGEAFPDSDFDLLIETSDTLTLKQRDMLADVAIDLTADYGALLDIHFYTKEEYGDSHCLVINPALKDGELVYAA